MIYKTNTSRKKDFETIREILDYNEYYEMESTIKYDKNFFFYTVHIKMKDEKENPRYLTGIFTSVTKKLFQAGFIIQKYDTELIDTSGIIQSFSLSDSVRVKHLVLRTDLILVRESEIDKYFLRGSFY